ncbi:MAG: hypothetical protein NDJ90_08810 [Oligoflexia bacterium]|nr:hypothetical protein [Oligoflexia bacterium]
MRNVPLLKPIWLVVALAMGASACGSSWFEAGKDEAVSRAPGYRQINKACANMDLSAPTLDVPTLRRIVKCFNANGAIDALERFVERGPEARLEALLRGGNRYLLGEPGSLYELDRTYGVLRDAGLLDESLLHLGRILQQEELISASLALLSSSEPRVLRAWGLLAERLNGPAVARALDLSLTLVETRAFAELQGRFRGASPSGRSLDAILRGVTAYLSERGGATEPGFDRALLEALEPVVGRTPEELRIRVPRIGSVLKVSFERNAKTMEGLSSLFAALHKRPISCLGGATSVEDGALSLLRELSARRGDSASYLYRDNVLNLMALGSACTFPAELDRFYPSVLELAASSAMEPAAELIRALYEIPGATPTQHPAAELLAGFLADPGLRLLYPALAELTDREAWEGILLVATSLGEEDRAALAEVPRVFGESLARANPATLQRWVKSFAPLIESEEPWAGPALRAFRAAFHANEAHPLLTLGRAVLKDAEVHPEFLEAVFAISDTPEFRDSLILLAEMTRDGRLRDLLDSVRTLYRKFSEQGGRVVSARGVPEFVPNRRHDLTVAQLVPYPLVRLPSGVARACEGLQPGFALDDPRHPEHRAQLDAWLRCLNARGEHTAAVEAVEVLRDHHTEDGRSFWEFQLDLVRELSVAREAMAFFIDGWTRALDDGRFGRVLSAVPLWSVRPMPNGTVLEPLVRALRPLAHPEPRAALGRLSLLGARVLRRTDAAELLRALDEALHREPPAPSKAPLEFDRALIADWVTAHEGRFAEDLDRRVEEIIDEFETSVSSWDLVEGKPRRSWSWAEFQTGLSGVLAKLGRTHAAGQGRHVHEAMLSIFRDFRDRPAELLSYLRERSTDHRLITYFYPGDREPRVRLVNSLDRLELILLEADFVAPPLNRNFGIQFLKDIAEAWGDEPYERWPEEIRRKQDRGETIRTLAEVVAEIELTYRLFEKVPGVPHLQARLHNIGQVLPILAQERDNGGLRVLRNLFFEIHDSTPRKFRAASSPENHLTIVMDLVRLGIFRNLGRLALQVPPGDPAAVAMLSGLTRAALAPDTRPLFDLLLVRDREHALLSSLIERVFLARESLRRLVTYLCADAAVFGFAEPAMTTLRAVVESEGELLRRHAVALDYILGARDLSRVLQALYETREEPEKARLGALLRELLEEPALALSMVTVARAVLDDPDALEAWREFGRRFRTMSELPEFRALRLEELGRGVTDFLQERTGEPDAVLAARELRRVLADRCEKRELEQYLLLLAADPQGFEKLFLALGRSIEQGGLPEFFASVRRSLEKGQ